MAKNEEEDFGVSMSLTKKEIIKKYDELLSAYERKVREAERAEEQRTEAEKASDGEAIVIAEQASVPGVVDAIASLRQVMSQSFGELSERLTEQTQRVEALDRAIELKRARLAELHDVDAAADALAKITRLYQERRDEAEAHFARRTEQMRAELARESDELGARIEAERDQWTRERSEAEAERDAREARAKIERERERADYLYERDLERKREEDDYKQRRAAQERELAETRERAERELAEREARLTERERELEQLRERAASFPDELERAAERAREQATELAERDARARIELAQKEHEWSSRVLTQRIEHLGETIEDLKAKIADQKRQLDASSERVQQIAERAVEGASMSRAYQSINDLAMEQARRPERSKTET